MKREWVIEVISMAFILLFAYAAISKLISYSTFVFQLGRSPYLEKISTFVSIAVPAGELTIVALLLFPRTKLLGLYASFALMLLFTVYIYVMLHYSYYVPCSCGGILQNMSWQQHFWFNVVFTLLGVAGILLKVMPDRPSQTRLMMP